MTENLALVNGTKDIFPKENQDDLSLNSPVSMFSWLVRAGEIIPAWWSRRRDVALRKVVIGNDHLSSAQYNFVSRLTATPVHVVAKDKSISSHVEQAASYERILHFSTVSRSDRTRQGWNFGFGMFLQDLTGVDNGGVFVIDGPGDSDGPLTGAPTRLIHLDSIQVSRTRSEEFPIVYTDYDGRKYKMHHTRVIIISSMPSTIQAMYGVGLCAISRCIHVSQILIDQLVYKEEKLGSRPKERLIIGKKGITGQDIAGAFYAADQSMNAQGMTRYSKTVVLAPNTRASSAEIDIDIQDLVDAGTIFDEQTSTTLGMYTVALAFGVPARWFWPATATGATKADAEIQHLVGMQQGPGEILRSVKEALDLKFLPPHLEISFDYQDDAQDRDQAEIKRIRAEQRKVDIEDSVITLRVAREQALDRGDINQAQFDAMELQDGRMPNGDALLAAFSDKRDTQLMEMLWLGVAEPLAIDENDPFDMINMINERALEVQGLTQNASSVPLKKKARIALHALGELKKLYEQSATDILAQEIKEEMEIMAMAMQGEEAMPVPPSPVDESPIEQEALQVDTKPPQEEVPQEEEQEEEVQEKAPQEEAMKAIGYGTKQYDFSVRGGEIIGGGLARDLEGKFISKDELSSAIRQGLLDRLRRKKGQETYTNSQNRDAVAGELGDRLPAGALDGLALLGEGLPLTGEVSDRLIAIGLARVDNAGQTRLTSAGASLLIAANKGDVERASDSLIRAQTLVGKGGSGGSGGGAGTAKLTNEEKQKEQEEKEAENRKFIASKLKGGANETSLEQIEAMEQVRLGNEISKEIAQSLADKGMLEYDDAGVPYLSFDGRVFINAANQGQLSLVRDVLARAIAKWTRKIERIDRLDKNISSNQKKVDELLKEVETFRGARTIHDITERAQLQNRINQLQDRIAKDTEFVEVNRIRVGRKKAAAIVEEVEEVVEKSKSMYDLIDDVLGIGRKDGLSDYRLDIRAAVRGLWSGTFTLYQFTDSMVSTIGRRLKQAWLEGAAKVGVKEGDLTEEELDQIEDIINQEVEFAYLFGKDIQEENKASGGKLEPLLARAEKWLNRYNEMVNLGMLSARDNPKFMWVIDSAAENCGSCTKLASKVKRKSDWDKADVRPQHPKHLECMVHAKGVPVCKCHFEVTEDAVSKGELPSLP